jgi:hypothetical protein
VKHLLVHLETQRHPVNKQGFIDENELFKLVVGTLKLCPVYEYEMFMDDIQPFQIGLLLDNHTDNKKEHYEMVSYAFRVGYISAKKGKSIPLFEKQQANKVSKVTKEQKENEFAELNAIFGNGF